MGSVRDNVDPARGQSISSEAWVVVRGYEKSVRVATDFVLSAHGLFRDVAQKNWKIRCNSLLFHILCTVEATEMLQLSRYLQGEHGTPIVTILHDALLVDGCGDIVRRAVEVYSATDAPPIRRRIRFRCGIV